VWYCNLIPGEVQAFEHYILSSAVQLNLLDKCSVGFSGKYVQDYVTWRVFVICGGGVGGFVLSYCDARISVLYHPSRWPSFVPLFTSKELTMLAQ